MRSFTALTSILLKTGTGTGSEILLAFVKVSVIWRTRSELHLAPAILPLTGRDNGYDITDYIGIHPALGDLGDFAAFMDEAANRGIRVIIDLVVNHTSDQHPWFKAARSRDPDYFDYYVWRNDRPGDTSNEVVFPGKQKAVWQYDPNRQSLLLSSVL